jgi:MFS family permease
MSGDDRTDQHRAARSGERVEEEHQRTPPQGRSGYSSRRATLVAAGVAVTSMLPMFLTGALVVQLTDDLAFGAAQLGIAVASFRFSSLVALPFFGVLADRIGAVLSLRIAALTSAVASAGIAFATDSYAVLVAWLMVAGCSQAIGQPAANRLVSQRVAPDRMGIAFGVKQAANPAATMLAGLSVPALALTLGWRWAYGLTCVLALLLVLAVGRRGRRPSGVAETNEKQKARMNRRVLVVFLASFGLAMAVAGAVPTFFVAAVVEAGGSGGFAGTFLAIASGGAVVTRLISGWACDQMASGHLRLFSAGLTLGSIGLVLLASGSPPLMAFGALIAMIGTWGFNGVFWYAIIREHPRAPGAVTGALLPGGNIGGIIGPVAIGFMVTLASYQVAWIVVAAFALVASYAMFRGADRIPDLMLDPPQHPLATADSDAR